MSCCQSNGTDDERVLDGIESLKIFTMYINAYMHVAIHI